MRALWAIQNRNANPMMAMRILLAVLMGVHRIAHLPGFLASWQIGRVEGLVYKTTVLSGHLDLGHAGIRTVALLWLFASLGFLLAASGAILGRSFWLPCAAIVATSSLVLSVLSWPDSRIGVAVNLVVLALLGIGLNKAWF